MPISSLFLAVNIAAKSPTLNPLGKTAPSPAVITTDVPASSVLKTPEWLAARKPKPTPKPSPTPDNPGGGRKD